VRAAALALVALAAAAPPPAAAQAIAAGQRAGASQASAPSAPSAPPLSAAGSTGSGGAGEEGAAAGSSAQTDPLVSNGLGSPSCSGAIAGELARVQRRNCETSGFVAAPAPTGDYGIDVHIDTGPLGVSSGEIWSAVQDLVITPLWMALVWAVHAVVAISIKVDL
jgi:hypothetical protein